MLERRIDSAEIFFDSACCESCFKNGCLLGRLKLEECLYGETTLTGAGYFLSGDLE